MMKRLFLLWLSVMAASSGPISSFASASNLGSPKNISVAEADKIAYLNEADDFIDAIPEGLQDRQADAVLHAMAGQTGELQQVRQSRNANVRYSPNVEVKELCPTEGVGRGLRMRLYRPLDAGEKKLPLLVYFHGGGWCFGSLNSCAAFCDSLASSGNVEVLAVDYRLAPENPYPAGLSDCTAALEYAFENAESLHTTKDMISAGGDSSGGNLALAAAMSLARKTDGSRSLKSLVLFYPVLRLRNKKTGSWREYSRGYGLDRRLMDSFSEAYEKGMSGTATIATEHGNAGMDEMLKSPALADDGMLRQLPPILLVSAERDILADQGEEFAARLKSLGNEVEYVKLPGAVHLFITVEGQPSAFRNSVGLTSDFLKR